MREIKYSIQELLGVGFTLIVLGIGLAYGIDVLVDIRDDFYDDNIAATGCNASDKTACGGAYNATVNGIEGVAKIPEKLPTIATVVVASVIIGILVTYLWARFARM